MHFVDIFYLNLSGERCESLRLQIGVLQRGELISLLNIGIVLNLHPQTRDIRLCVYVLKTAVVQLVLIFYLKHTNICYSQ